MEENVALDSNKQKQFVKSIKGIKKLIKKKKNGPKPPAAPKPESSAKDKKRKVKERGLVYLSHIPHGFYENEMTQYFKQFGRVTNVRVIRSKRTGNSRGCAFVEFSEPAVAQIVAETMNNYLMGKRLIKAALVPPEKQRRHALRKNWNQLKNPGHDSRIKLKKTFNAKKTDEEDLRRARNILKNLDKTKKRLKEMGIDYDFFTPVDVPEELLNKPEGKPANDSKISIQAAKSSDVVKKEKAKKGESKLSNVPIEKPVKATKDTIKPAKKDNKKPVADQGNKQQKIKDGMKLPENFIKIAQSASDDDSDDGSMVFDSDEFEKAQQFDEEFDSDAEESGSEDGEGSDDEEGDEESSEDEPPTPIKGPFKPKQQPAPKAGKGKPAVRAPPSKQVQKAKPSLQPQPVQKRSPENKRKAPQKPEVNSKKQKFEKKGKQQAKIFKKKK